MNPGGSNQTSPGVSAGRGVSPGMSATPIFTPAGGMTGSTNPYTTTLPTGAGSFSPTAGITSTLPGTDPTQQMNLTKQLTDIYGKGVGGQEAALFSGMGGTNSAAFQAYLQSMAPVNAAQMANLKQQEGAAGISGNSSVDAIAASNLLAQQNAQAAGVNSQMIMQNQQNQLGLLHGMQGDAASEVASSGWDVFGNVLNTIGQVGGEVLGAVTEAGGLSSLFKGAGAAAGGVGSSFLSSYADPSQLTETSMSGFNLPTSIG